MVFDWKEYLNLARSLETRQEEASLRSAVSRSYFGAFCYARNYARDHQNFFPSGKSSDHTGVREHFQTHSMPDIARRLQRLREWRNQCDYDDEVENIIVLVRQAMDYAQKIIDVLP